MSVCVHLSLLGGHPRDSPESVDRQTDGEIDGQIDGQMTESKVSRVGRVLLQLRNTTN